MFNPTLVVIEAFIRELRTMYERTYGMLEPGYPGTISFDAQLALKNIATSDAAYHDVNHTILVTLVGQEILRGRHISVGGITPRDWLRFIVSLLRHDIGYVRGICRGVPELPLTRAATGDIPAYIETLRKSPLGQSPKRDVRVRPFIPQSET
jgi:hypothetical protein